MNVKISDYGQDGEKYFIDYEVSGLTEEQLKYLHHELEEKTSIDESILTLTMYFSHKLYPFQSDVAKRRLEDFISREEIEMNVFLSSFLEDM
jgi:hypothetical protein